MILSFIATFLFAYLVLSLILPARIQRKGVCLLAVMVMMVVQQIFMHTHLLEYLSSFLNSGKHSITAMRLYYPIGVALIYAFLALLLRKVSKKGIVLLTIIVSIGVRAFDLDSVFFAAIRSTKVPLYLLVLQAAGIFVFVLFILLTFVETSYALIRKVIHLFSKKDEELSSFPLSFPEPLSKTSDLESPSSSGIFSLQRRTFLKLTMATLPTIYSVKEAIRLPAVKPMELAVDALPDGLDGLRIVQITDLHASILFGEDWVRGVVERVNNLKPDLILFTGDMTDGTPAQRRKDVSPLADLIARYGTFGCMGNHDYYSSYSGWMKMLPRLGITMLENTHQALRIRGASLVIAGVPDIVAGNYNLPMPNPKAAFANVPDGSFRIMLDHRPGNAAKNAKAGAHLQLSGHTHGGQVLGMDLIVKEKNNGFVRGWYTVNKMSMYVGSGAGLWSGFPIRFGVPSELPCITLRKA